MCRLQKKKRQKEGQIKRRHPMTNEEFSEKQEERAKDIYGKQGMTEKKIFVWDGKTKRLRKWERNYC